MKQGTRRHKSISPDRLLALADLAPMLVWVTDHLGNFVILNEVWKEFTGRGSNELAGEGWHEAIHSDDRAMVIQVFSSALIARQPFKVECRLTHEAGDMRHVALSGTPQFDGEKFLGYLGTGLDISHRRRNQEALRESESRYRELAESIGHLFCALDRELRFTYWNSACESTIGLPATLVVGKKLDEVFPGIQTHAVRPLLERVLETGVSATAAPW